MRTRGKQCELLQLVRVAKDSGEYSVWRLSIEGADNKSNKVMSRRCSKGLLRIKGGRYVEDIVVGRVRQMPGTNDFRNRGQVSDLDGQL